MDPARIAGVRREELREACARLGVTDVRMLGYRDSGIPARGEPGSLSAAPLGQVARDLSRVLAALRPDLVITHDRTGGYGHPDHIRASEAAALAVRDLDPVPVLYESVFPRSLVDAFQDAFRDAGLRAGRAAATGADMDRDAGVPDALVSARLDVSAHVQAKRAALRAHRTQLTGHVLFRLPWPVLARLWSVEHFARAGVQPGGPVADDLG